MSEDDVGVASQVGRVTSRLDGGPGDGFVEVVGQGIEGSVVLRHRLNQRREVIGIEEDLSQSCITVPFEEYPPDPNRLQWAPSAKGLWKVILNDQPLPKKYREDVISAAKPPGTPSGTPTGTATASGSPSQSPSQSPSSTPSPSAPPEADQNGLCT